MQKVEIPVDICGRQIKIGDFLAVPSRRRKKPCTLKFFYVHDINLGKEINLIGTFLTKDGKNRQPVTHTNLQYTKCYLVLDTLPWLK